METERSGDPGEAPAGDLKQAAVVLIVYEQDGEPYLLLTRRTERVADHKGQICFPGGSLDLEDKSAVSAALREAEEELGVDPRSLRLVAGLEPVYTVVTRYVIEPFVAYSPRRPELRPDSFEVAEVIDVRVAALLDPTARRVETWDTHGAPREVYFYQYGSHVIWGATARILSQFLESYTPEWWQAVVSGKADYRPPAGLPPVPV